MRGGSFNIVRFVGDRGAAPGNTAKVLAPTLLVGDGGIEPMPDCGWDLVCLLGEGGVGRTWEGRNLLGESSVGAWEV